VPYPNSREIIPEKKFYIVVTRRHTILLKAALFLQKQIFEEC
jgi:hypothetical protein